MPWLPEEGVELRAGTMQADSAIRLDSGRGSVAVLIDVRRCCLDLQIELCSQWARCCLSEGSLTGNKKIFEVSEADFMRALKVVTSTTSISCHVGLMRSVCVVMRLSEHACGIEGRTVS
jgi:hypothetical protein